MSTASKVAEDKLNHPHKFCPVSRCLWRTGGAYCPRHAPAVCACENNGDLCDFCHEKEVRGIRAQQEREDRLWRQARREYDIP